MSEDRRDQAEEPGTGAGTSDPPKAEGAGVDEFGIPVLTEVVGPEARPDTVEELLRARLSEELARALPGLLEEAVESALRRVAPKLEIVLRNALANRLAERIDEIITADRGRD